MNKKQCVVIGLGRFGTSVAETLSTLGNEVLAIDIKEENVRHISANVSHALQANITDEDVINSIGLNDFDIAVVGIGADVESSCLAIIALKQANVPKIIAKAKNEECGKILSAVGATTVIYPERDMGARVAHNINSSNIIDFFEFSDEYSIAETLVPDWASNKTIYDLKIREKHHLNIIAIKTNNKINADVQRDTVLEEGSVLVITGKNKDIMKFR